MTGSKKISMFNRYNKKNVLKMLIKFNQLFNCEMIGTVGLAFFVVFCLKSFCYIFPQKACVQMRRNLSSRNIKISFPHILQILYFHNCNVHD